MSTAAVELGRTWSAEHTDERGHQPLRPALDPFYRPPPGWESTEPGTPLRSRDVDPGFLGRIPLQAKAVQLLYRTVDMHGSPTTTVTTVLIAHDAPALPDRPILSYQCAIDALSPEAFPSYAHRLGSPTTGEVVQLELLQIAISLAQGWVVSVPDHEGPHGSWGAPRESGHCALDGVRAALRHHDFGLDERSPVGLWGYSGGGWGTSWAAEMAEGYAPELQVVGAALGSPVGDPELVFRRANGHLYAGLTGLVIASLVRIYPTMRALVEEYVDADGRALLERAIDLPTAHAIVRMAFTNFGKFMSISVDAFLDDPRMQAIFADIRPGLGAPAMPVLILQAVHDQIVPVAGIDRMAKGFADRGTTVTYVRDRLSEHFTLHIFSAPIVITWLTDRFAGVEVIGSSTTTVRTVLGSSQRLRTGVELLRVCGRVFRGKPLITATDARE